jgi:small subunit ribosomal protein S20
MPNTPSAIKRMRQEERRRAHNNSIKSRVKTYITKARAAISSPAIDAATAEAAVRAAVSELDRAAKKGVIHKNNAARRKSRLMKQLNAK